MSQSAKELAFGRRVEEKRELDDRSMHYSEEKLILQAIPKDQ